MAMGTIELGSRLRLMQAFVTIEILVPDEYLRSKVSGLLLLILKNRLPFRTGRTSIL